MVNIRRAKNGWIVTPAGSERCTPIGEEILVIDEGDELVAKKIFEAVLKICKREGEKR